MPRPKPTVAQYREKYADLVKLVDDGATVRNACRVIGMSYSNACTALHLCGYKRIWVKIEDDGTETQFDAW